MSLLDEDGEPITREWYAPTEASSTGLGLTWPGVLSHWNAIETDMHHFYGADMENPEVLGRSWRWFTIRITRLIGEDTALWRALRPQDDQGQNTPHGDT